MVNRLDDVLLIGAKYQVSFEDTGIGWDISINGDVETRFAMYLVYEHFCLGAKLPNSALFQTRANASVQNVAPARELAVRRLKGRQSGCNALTVCQKVCGQRGSGIPACPH